MKKLSNSYLSNVNGNTTMIFAVSMMSVVLAAGAAIDFGRMADAKITATAITDAAALAAVSNSGATEEEMIEIARKYVDTNIEGLEFELDGEPDFAYDPATGEFTVSIDAEASTSLLSLAGIAKVGVSARSVAVKPELPPVEMVLALDTTGSMAGSKIESLKTAATKMVQAVLKNDNAKIGIVPFSNYVNVGVGLRNNEYMSVPADTSNTVNICSNTYPYKQGCVWTTTYKACNKSGDGTAMNDLCPVYTQTCESWGEVVQVCKDYTSTAKFSGCVGSRDEIVRAVIKDGTKRYPGLQNTDCSTEIMDLTTDLSKAEKVVKSLTATGETYLPGGLTWGWNMLTAAEPLTTASTTDEMTLRKVRKVLVFMTDGANTLVPQHTGASRHVAPGATGYNIAYTNQLTASLCANIKKDNISIYTVQFDVADSALQSLLTNCASSEDMSFQASDADGLVAAFDNILKDLAEIRVVQ